MTVICLRMFPPLFHVCERQITGLQSGHRLRDGWDGIGFHIHPLQHLIHFDAGQIVDVELAGLSDDCQNSTADQTYGAASVGGLFRCVEPWAMSAIGT